ncbi:MAG: S-methyl-5'-thioadenosine phosphorylase [Planctomycetota bacterium]
MNETIKIAVIGGSGLGEALHADDATEHFPDTPFGKPSAPILETTLDGVPVLLLRRHGIGHVHNPSAVPYRANVFALKQLGATHVLASGAVGSLRETMEPRHLVLPDSTIDKTTKRANTFYEHAAVHVGFDEPFCPVLRKLLADAAAEVEGVTLHDRGTYVCMEGPSFSTKAESHMHRLWGGDLIGMTLMPEARLAREAELPYAAVCLVTDYDCWRPHDASQGPQDLLTEIIGHLKAATANAMSLLRAALAMSSTRTDELLVCPARDALALGIWSDKSKIDPAEIERLEPLWGRHFG